MKDVSLLFRTRAAAGSFQRTFSPKERAYHMNLLVVVDFHLISHDCGKLL